MVEASAGDSEAFAGLSVVEDLRLEAGDKDVVFIRKSSS